MLYGGREEKSNIVCAVCIDSPDLSAGMAVWLSKEPRPWLNGRCRSCVKVLTVLYLADTTLPDVAANWDVDELLARKDEIANSDMLKFRMVV